MRPKLFRLNDLLFMWIAAIVGLAPPITAHLSHSHADTWGEAVPFQGWLIAYLVFATTLAIVIAFYWKRAAWLKHYRYTTKHGVMCFFESGATVYAQETVEHDTAIMLDQWIRYYLGIGRNESRYINAGVYLKNSTCIFKPEHHWKEAGQLGRLVRGLAGWNWAQVGQGGDPIEKTAFRHEMAHLHLNHVDGMQVPEDEAHTIFKNAGIS